MRREVYSFNPQKLLSTVFSLSLSYSTASALLSLRFSSRGNRLAGSWNLTDDDLAADILTGKTIRRLDEDENVVR